MTLICYLVSDRKETSVKKLPRILVVNALLSTFFSSIPFFVGRSIGKEMGQGLPITRNDVSYNDRTFQPQAVMKVGQSVLIIDPDNRVYSLDGVKFEEGLSPTNILSGTNDLYRYIVYNKGGDLYFGKYIK